MNEEDITKFRKAVREFDEEHIVEDIILLGRDGAIRRIMLGVDEK
jgi:hypothetical protein